jgi:hypothetical protein
MCDGSKACLQGRFESLGSPCSAPVAQERKDVEDDIWDGQKGMGVFWLSMEGLNILNGICSSAHSMY